MPQLLDPITPGEILLEEFMYPLKLSQNQLARDIDIAPARISEIIKNKTSITAITALRFAKYFNTTPEFWLNLQMDYDLRWSSRTIWKDIEPRIRPFKPKLSDEGKVFLD